MATNNTCCREGKIATGLYAAPGLWPPAGSIPTCHNRAWKPPGWRSELRKPSWGWTRVSHESFPGVAPRPQTTLFPSGSTRGGWPCAEVLGQALFVCCLWEKEKLINHFKLKFKIILLFIYFCLFFRMARELRCTMEAKQKCSA